MLHSLGGLRLNAVVACDYQDDHIGCFGAARTHRAKRCVSWSIQEAHHPVIGVDVVGANMLCDATRFVRGDSRFANIIEQRRFTVVDVSHHSNHRCTRDFDFADLGCQRFCKLLFESIFGHEFRTMPHFFDQ